MQFFKAQENAKKNTVFLIFLFVLNIFFISALNAAVAFLLVRHQQTYLPWPFLLKIFFASCVFFVASAAFFILRAPKGTALAEYMGGRLVQFPIQDPLEKRLFNIVEEMSIAAGVAVPFVYILQNEKSINAFAAGTDAKNIVVAVTRGALEAFTRDELQAVIGHEYSHILNDDLQLNVNIAGVVSGFQVIMHFGRAILNSASSQSSDSFGQSRRQKNKGQAALIGLLIMVIGSIGFFLGRMIQSMISRQREFLADASSAQFTRNPQALATALAKISALGGSGITSVNSIEYSHIFFAEAFQGLFSGVFSTHPKVSERIQRLLPGKNYLNLVAEVKDKFQKSEFYNEFVEEKSEIVKKYSQSLVKPKEKVVNPKEDIQRILMSIGAPTALSLDLSQKSLLGLQKYRELIQNSEIAKMALLMSCVYSQPNNHELYKAIQAEMPAAENEFDEVKTLTEADPATRVLVFNLALGVLRTLGENERKQMIQYIEKLFLIDNKCSYLEATLVFLTKRILLKAKDLKNKQNLTLFQAENGIKNLIFWTLTNGEKLDSFSETDQEKIKLRFQESLGLLNLNANMDFLAQINFAASEKSFDEVSRVVRVKKDILVKSLYAILVKNDDQKNLGLEAFRLTCLALNVPIPI